LKGMDRILLLSVLLCLAAFASAQDGDFIGGAIGPGTESPGGNIGMSNPSADYCSNQGYEYSGGNCVFPDGSSCDAWAFYRGECEYEPKPAPEPEPEPIVGPGTETPGDGGSVIGMPNPASVYCAAQGYKLETRTDPTTGGEVGYCVFPDGSSCEEWAFYRGQCQYDPKPKPQPTPTPTPVPPVPKPQAPIATYTCDAPPASQQEAILDYDAKSAPPGQVYFMGSFVSWRNFEDAFPATSPALWIETSSGWSWNAVCPLGAWMSEVIYLPRNGSVSLYLMDFSGNARQRQLGAATEGYKQITLYTNSPGQKMAIFTLDGVPSNVVFIDVKSDWTPCGTRDVSTSASPEVDLVP
jgi:putative hemolysin